MAHLLQSTDDLRALVAEERYDIPLVHTSVFLLNEHRLLEVSSTTAIRCQEQFDRMTDAAGTLESKSRCTLG
jgi:hypothetical protein